MKKIGFLSFFVLCFSFSFAQKKAAIQESVLSVMHLQQMAWNNGDIDGFMLGYWHNDSLQFVGKNITYGWQNTLNNYKKSYPTKAKMGTLLFSDLKVDVLSSKAAFVIGAWQIVRSDKSVLGGHFTLLFKKINGTWQIVVDHTS